MSLISYALSETSIVFRVKILDSSATTGAGITGLTSASAGMIIGTIADNEATTTTYTVTASNVETITTLGTYAAPTASKCRFKEVDATNHKGVYEIHLADARFAIASSKSLLVSIAGASNAAETDVVIPLTSVDPYDSVRGGMTALPNAAADAAGGLPVSDLGSLDLDTQLANTNEITVARMGALTDWIDAGRLDAILDIIAADTAVIGALGAGLTNIPWNASWDAEVESEVNDALVVLQLDHLLHVADASTTTNNSIISKMVSSSATAAFSSFVNTTDSLQAIRDNTAWDTAVGFSTHTAADVWTSGTRTLTATGLDLILKSSTYALAMADAVWDEVLTGATHNVTSSSGKRLRQIDAGFEVLSGTATAGGASSITFEVGADAVNDNIYSGDRIVITGGTGVGEHGLILSYDSGTLTATMSKAWIVAPDNTSEYVVAPADVDVELWNDNSVTGDGDWAALKAETALIVADTNELQTDWLNGGRLDLILDIIAVDTTTDIPALIATAQADLDTITGTDGVTLATAQALYAPSTAAALASLVTTVGVAGAGLTDLQMPADGLDLVLVDGKTLPVSLQLIAASAAGKISGAGTGTETVVGIDGATTRITATVDVSGNRSAMVYP